VLVLDVAVSDMVPVELDVVEVVVVVAP
jgi:hypothetical protein